MTLEVVKHPEIASTIRVTNGSKLVLAKMLYLKLAGSMRNQGALDLQSLDRPSQFMALAGALRDGVWESGAYSSFENEVRDELLELLPHFARLASQRLVLLENAWDRMHPGEPADYLFGDYLRGRASEKETYEKLRDEIEGASSNDENAGNALAELTVYECFSLDVIGEF